MKPNALSFALVGLAFGLAFSACGRGERGGTPAPQAQAREVAAVSVAVAKIQMGNLTETASVTGDLQSYNDVVVATKLGGRFVEVRVREGDRVRKGDVIAVQDPTDLQLQLRQAESAMRAAEANLQQAEIAARTQPAQTEAQIQAAKAALEAARARLRALQTGARPKSASKLSRRWLPPAPTSNLPKPTTNAPNSSINKAPSPSSS